jgi:hypothetical protein
VRDAGRGQRDILQFQLSLPTTPMIGGSREKEYLIRSSLPFLGAIRRRSSAWPMTVNTGSLHMCVRTISVSACVPRTRLNLAESRSIKALGRCRAIPTVVFKQSGMGRVGSLEGMLEAFTQRKSVMVNLNTRAANHVLAPRFSTDASSFATNPPQHLGGVKGDGRRRAQTFP